MIEFKQDVRYAYATGRIRVLETKLLSSSRVEKMIESTTPQDALRYLEGTTYDDTIAGIKELENYNKQVIVEKKLSFDLMEKLILEDSVKELFRIPYDFHNVKVLLKAKWTNMDVSDLLSDFGTIPSDIIKEAFETEHFSLLPDFIQECVAEAMAQYYINKNIKEVEFVIDRLESRHQLFVSIKSEIPFLEQYVKIKIDLANISSMIRIQYFKTLDKMEDILIDGGNLDIRFYNELRGKTLEEIIPVFKNTPYNRIVDNGIRPIIQKGSFSVFEREKENFIMNYMKLTRYVTFGVEPVVCYFVFRESDINIIKMILLGKLNGLSKKEIKERVPVSFN